MKEYTLHSKGENWYHFRAHQDSICESFTVSYLHDGTCVLSGDYGTLTWKRQCFPPKLDYGFPGKDTHIHYFAEKICEFPDNFQKITFWNKTKAIEQIKKVLEEYEDIEAKQELIAALERTNAGIQGEMEMYDLLQEYYPSGDWWEGNYGEDYTDHFKFQFAILQQVSDVIYEDKRGEPDE